MAPYSVDLQKFSTQGPGLYGKLMNSYVRSLATAELSRQAGTRQHPVLSYRARLVFEFLRGRCRGRRPRRPRPGR